MKVLVALLFTTFLLASAKQHTRWHQLKDYTFDHYVKEFGKIYATPEEKESRRALFETKLHKIRKHNEDTTKTWKEGVNHLSDRTPQEFKRLLGTKPMPPTWGKPRDVVHVTPEQIAALPPKVDWREKGIITDVKDQGDCGSCWTFATAEVVEAYWALKTGELHVLSEQQILDCTPNPLNCGGTGGCDGGTTELAILRLQAMGGLSSEWTYPYTSYFGQNFNCTQKNVEPIAKLMAYGKLPSNEYDPVMQHLATVGPLAISVDASTWGDYEEGVFNGCNNAQPDIDHGVLLVGYGMYQDNQPYWLVRNSWSPGWGDFGYIRLARAKNSASVPCGTDIHPHDGDGCKNSTATIHVCGECAILYDPIYAIVN